MKIAIGFVTYPIHWERIDYLTRAFLAAKQCLEASRDELLLFCTCEHMPSGERFAHVAALCNRYAVTLFSNSKPPSVGSNQNNAMRVAFEQLSCDFLMVHQDDSYATGKIDLSDGVGFLQHNPDVDILRYHWSGRKTATPIFHERPDSYMQVDSASSWFYDDSPHIRRASFVEKFGWQREGTPEESGPIERELVRQLRSKRANIAATPFKLFEKDGPRSASR